MKTGILRTNTKKPIAEMNIVPYVDVMLVLLVIFMVTAPMLTQGVNVELPIAEAEPLKKKDKLPLLVTVNKEGKVFLNISATPMQSISYDLLQAEVVAALTLDPKQLVLVRGDKNVTYEKVLHVMVVLKRAGVPNVGLETKQLT